MSDETVRLRDRGAAGALDAVTAGAAVRGMRAVSDLPMLTEAMLARGWSEQRIRKFLGGNVLRVVGQVTEEKK